MLDIEQKSKIKSLQQVMRWAKDQLRFLKDGAQQIGDPEIAADAAALCDEATQRICKVEEKLAVRVEDKIKG